VVGDLGTYAGLITNRHSRALDGDRQPISGPYAVGNDTASIIGGNYPGAGIKLGPASGRFMTTSEQSGTEPCADIAVLLFQMSA
jgi:hypothetical protein